MCPLCGWIDDIVQLRFADFARDGLPNNVSLLRAQQYVQLGVCNPEAGNAIRSLQSDEPIDPDWHMIDMQRDTIAEPSKGWDDFSTYPPDTTKLYYWLKE